MRTRLIYDLHTAHDAGITDHAQPAFRAWLGTAGDVLASLPETVVDGWVFWVSHAGPLPPLPPHLRVIPWSTPGTALGDPSEEPEPAEVSASPIPGAPTLETVLRECLAEDGPRPALLACPFMPDDVEDRTGDAAPYLVHDAADHYVVCPMCGARGPRCDDDASAVTAWNSAARVPAP